MFNFKPGRISFSQILLAFILALPIHQAQGSCPGAADVADLISQLDSEKFESRELATNKLIVIGESALRPLAFHFYTASPEAAWRIKRVFHEIGTNSQQEITSLKAIGLLMLLDHQLDSELSEMLETWRQNRSRRAIQHVVNKGAKIVSNGNANGLVRPQIVFGNIAVTDRTNNSLRRPQRKKLAWPDAKKKIEKVVGGELDDVQRIVFENLPAQRRNPQDQLVNELGLRHPVLGGRATNNQQVSLEIGKDFQGNFDDLARLREVHTLASLKFKDKLIDEQQLDLIASLPGLSHIGFDNTKARGGHLFDIELPANLSSIELKNQMIESATISWLTSIPLKNLTIESCKFSDAAFDKFPALNQLQFMMLKRVNLGRKFFGNLAKMHTVRDVYMSVCKFDADDYRDFTKLRPRKIINFNPVSFLGVQGTPTLRDPRKFSCKIEQVVSGSGAEAAGVKAGDIVEAVNGFEIENFDELRMFISQLDVGERMTLKVDRNGKKMELSATLGVNENRFR